MHMQLAADVPCGAQQLPCLHCNFLYACASVSRLLARDAPIAAMLSFCTPGKCRTAAAAAATSSHSTRCSPGGRSTTSTKSGCTNHVYNTLSVAPSETHPHYFSCWAAMQGMRWRLTRRGTSTSQLYRESSISSTVQRSRLMICWPKPNHVPNTALGCDTSPQHGEWRHDAIVHPDQPRAFPRQAAAS